MSPLLKQRLKLSTAAQNALANKRPIVALESTLISHGLPWPENRDLAFALEDIVRSHGAVPATIGVIKGEIKVGLERDELTMVAESGFDCRKISSFDLPWALVKNETATTTVAGTIHIANLCGIEVMATGGIGGVHRDAHLRPDVSHDLVALSQTRMIVVSSGAKAILNLDATVEALETLGVLTVGYRTRSFPGFYFRDSGLPLNCSTESVDEIVSAFRFGQRGAVLVVNPVAEADEIPHSVIEPIIREALKEADERGIRGKDLTPVLLDAIAEKTRGKSTVCNVSLIRGNVDLASRIAHRLR